MTDDQPSLFRKGATGTGRRPQPGRAPGTRQRRNEEASRQYWIVKTLRTHRYTVKETSQRINVQGSGIDRGIGDVLVTHISWPPNVWLMIEVKANEKSRVSPEQAELRDCGRLVVCWTVEQALRAVHEFETWLKQREWRETALRSEE